MAAVAKEGCLQARCHSREAAIGSACPGHQYVQRAPSQGAADGGSRGRVGGWVGGVCLRLCRQLNLILSLDGVNGLQVLVHLQRGGTKKEVG